MSRMALVVICAVMAVGGMALESARGQSDLSKVLIGKWEGDVQLPGRGDPKRTLVIDSVDASGKSAQGRWGIAGKGLGRVSIAIEDDAGKVWLKFTTGTNISIRLQLVGDKNLVGTNRFAGTGEGVRDLPVRLEKAN